MPDRYAMAMHGMRMAFGAALLATALSGCVARAAWDVATLPVKAGSQVVDWTTTSHDERDRNYGRKMRKEQKRAEREARRSQKN